MFRVDSRTPGSTIARTTSDGATVFLRPNFQSYFSPTRYGRYADFTTPAGEILKDEARTTITRFRAAEPGVAGPGLDFAVKHYRYSRAAQRRTWYRQSVAHAEFCALCHLVALGVPCVGPVACGLRRTRVGTVESCFLITEFAEGFVSLRDWLREHATPSAGEIEALRELARGLGRDVRRMHAQRLFVSRLSAKNLLIRFAPGGPIQWRLIDHPFAGFHRGAWRARFMQSYDLGRLKNSLMRYGQEPLFEEFVRAYLPDPLGRSEATLRKGIAYGVDIRHDRTPLLRALKGIERVFRSPGAAATRD